MKHKAVLILLAIVFLAPIYFLFTGSLQDIRGVFAMPPQVIPRGITLANYAWLFTLPFWQWALNTLLVVGIGVTLSVLVVTGAAYSFAFYRFAGKKALWLLMLSGIMIPAISLVIPRFVVMTKLGLSGTMAAAILPAALYPVGLYLARTYFETVPRSLLESARIDGASEPQILVHVVAPVSKPIITALALFTAVMYLGDFMWQMLQLQRTERQTLLVGLMRSVMRFGGTDMQVNPIGRSLAVGVVLLVPLLAVFFGASRYFVTALGGAVRE